MLKKDKNYKNTPSKNFDNIILSSFPQEISVRPLPDITGVEARVFYQSLSLRFNYLTECKVDLCYKPSFNESTKIHFLFVLLSNIELSLSSSILTPKSSKLNMFQSQCAYLTGGSSRAPVSASWRPPPLTPSWSWSATQTSLSIRTCGIH